jgi:hypothetical protein
VLIRRAIVLGCALVVLGAGCSDSDGSGEAAPTTTASAPTTTRAPSTTTTTRPDQTPPSALEGLILSDVPGGFKRQSDEIADTGPADLDKAALDDVTCNVGCDARQALTSAGFVDGYQRAWTSVDDAGSTVNQDYVYLYEFETPEGAQEYAQHWRETLLTSAQGAQIVSFTPAFIPGAVGLQVSDRLGSTGVAIFAKGPYAVRAVVNGGPSVDQSGSVSALASQQYQNLP